MAMFVVKFSHIQIYGHQQILALTYCPEILSLFYSLLLLLLQILILGALLLEYGSVD